MKNGSLKTAPGLCLEIRQHSLQVLRGEDGLELPLERLPNGSLAPACKARVISELQSFLKPSSWRSRPRVACAIGARGVSLRRLSLPAANGETMQQLLRLQIEREFPLSPDELAWGWRGTGGSGVSTKQQEILVVAVKKETLGDYIEILNACGLAPAFTLAALARAGLCRRAPRAYAVLDLGRNQSELVSFEQGQPVSVRVLPWGGENITREIETGLAISRDEAENLKVSLGREPFPNGEQGPKLKRALDVALESLAGVMPGNFLGGKIYLTGKTAKHPELAERLTGRLGKGTDCELLGGGADTAAGRSAANLGLRAVSGDAAADGPVILQTETAAATATRTKSAPWQWAAAAVVLAIAVLCLPFAEALILKPRLARKLAALKADTRRLPLIDRELGFLQFLKQSQPPYLDALYLLSRSAPQGSRLDSLAMNRRGDLSWRGTMRDATQVSDFRSKLIDSGFFTNVVVEEQTPAQNRQNVTVRMSAQWKSATARAALAIGPTPAEIEKAKNAKDAPAGNMPPGFPPGMSFPGMPPGMNISVGPPPPRSGKRMPSAPRGAGPVPGGAPVAGPDGQVIVVPADGSPVIPGKQPPGTPSNP